MELLTYSEKGDSFPYFLRAKRFAFRGNYRENVGRHGFMGGGLVLGVSKEVQMLLIWALILCEIQKD